MDKDLFEKMLQTYSELNQDMTFDLNEMIDLLVIAIISDIKVENLSSNSQNIYNELYEKNICFLISPCFENYVSGSKEIS